MDKIIAYCGLVCTDCDAYVATQNDDNEKRKEIAAKWSKEYNHPMTADDINCVGCIVTDGKHIGQCFVCEVRKCGQEKGVENCAYCEDYACDNLNKYFAMAPVMKDNLDRIRKELKK